MCIAKNDRRLDGYASQVGKKKTGGVCFTNKQRRRFIKKARRAQRIWEAM